MWEKLKDLFSAEALDVLCTMLLFALTFSSILLVMLGYYFDAICGFLAVISVSEISAYIDRKRINTQLKTWLEKNGNR